jgi:polysaccharide export outer membrane protein
MKLLSHGVFASVCLFVGVIAPGCSSAPKDTLVLDQPKTHPTTGQTSAVPPSILADTARFHVGETVIVTFTGAPMPVDPHSEPIKEDGTISLDLIGKIRAVGKTAGELQNEIYTNYVPKYYTRLTVTVNTGDRLYYLGGEVRSPGRQIYVDGVTVTKAIQTAGGMTDFANHHKVWLTHENGQRIKVDYDKALQNPSKDPAVYPNDQIVVDKSLW